MTDYQSLHSTALGYSHILKQIGCEDYSASLDEESVHIAVVSDGHGDTSCFRSQLGSQFAVEIALEQLRSFAAHIRAEQWEQRLLDPIQQETLVRQLIRSIMGNWTIRVLDHLEASPITDAEWAQAGAYRERYEQGIQLKHIYGCTLIAILVTPTYLLALQQGDGRCVLVRSNGKIQQPVPWDPRCVGNISTSLCLDDAVESCRYYVEDLRCHSIAACFACSDGIEDSMEDQQAVNAYFGHLTSLYPEKGAPGITALLDETLPEMSQYGSLDDMSVAGVCADTISPLLAQHLELAYQRSTTRQKQAQAADKVLSMQRKSEFLQQEVSTAEKAFLAARKAGHDADGTVDALKAARAAAAEYEAKRSQFRAMEAQAAQTLRELDDACSALASLPDDPQPAETSQTPEWEFAQEIPWEPLPDTQPEHVPDDKPAGDSDSVSACEPDCAPMQEGCATDPAPAPTNSQKYLQKLKAFLYGFSHKNTTK